MVRCAGFDLLHPSHTLERKCVLHTLRLRQYGAVLAVLQKSFQHNFDTPQLPREILSKTSDVTWGSHLGLIHILSQFTNFLLSSFAHLHRKHFHVTSAIVDMEGLAGRVRTVRGLPAPKCKPHLSIRRSTEAGDIGGIN